MSLIIPSITVATAATMLNAILTFIQYTLGLALVAILIYILPTVNNANTWTVVSREIQASSWATLLRSGSAASRRASFRVKLFSKASIPTSILIAMTAIVTPLGLKEGPILHSATALHQASYLPDTSPLALATSPRQNFTYGRICGATESLPCPGNGDNWNTSLISPKIVQRFNSTPYGPFSMEFRQYFTGEYGYNITRSVIGTVESLILREGMFVVDGLIVDMGKTPGIGLLNHTIPDNIPNDRGGFVNLTKKYPSLERNGQNPNVYQHAYNGVVLSNLAAMLSFNNMTRNESFIGKAFPLQASDTYFMPGKATNMDLFAYLQNATAFKGLLLDSDGLCRGFGGGDSASITNISVQCGLFLGPPRRTDGGDPRVPAENLTWTQSLHGCATASRASIQRVQFSLNETRDFNSIQAVSRNLTGPLLWAVEKTDLNITDVDLLWGVVDQKYEEDLMLDTIQNDYFYLPAGATDIWGEPGVGNPSPLPALSSSRVYKTAASDVLATSIVDYSGQSNYALLQRYLSLINKDMNKGTAQIMNLIWTDILANNVLGTHTSSALLAAPNVHSVTYDLIYAIPLLLLLIIWVPSLLTAVGLLSSKVLKISYIQNLLIQTSIGRVVMGDSALVPVEAVGPTTGKYFFLSRILV
ncbi:hypothetical protein M422DRAFT_269906 [Sphaerobolus stellatus SS14]|uniref:Unplaced genomic scaffold SPHSTscaffold_223, whole genome shotgun sequence n=1 Tax=Sphaerobolus stellatus (strain SS14) TaxID=990650 RepID=A0A0C9UU91_SPHS4|nr:hypothetical protein M422DRAFT_269906 [Sphaerobolus stellatus SS14]